MRHWLIQYRDRSFLKNTESMFMKNIVVSLCCLFALSIQPLHAQDASCPTVPPGLIQVADMEWIELGHSVLISIGQPSHSEYTQIHLQWDLTSGELMPVVMPGTVEVLQVVAYLGLASTFFSAMGDTTHITLSPQLDYAVYSIDSLLYAFNRNMRATTVIGTLPDNLTDFEVIWLPNDEAVIVIEPIYGEGSEIYHVCLDSDCMVNVSSMVNAFTTRPAINAQNQIVFFEIASQRLVTYDIATRQIANRYSVSVLPYTLLSPIWSADGDSMYFLGFDTNLALFQYQISTQEQTLVTEIPIDAPATIQDWLLSIEGRFIILGSQSGIYVHCY